MTDEQFAELTDRITILEDTEARLSRQITPLLVRNAELEAMLKRLEWARTLAVDTLASTCPVCSHMKLYDHGVHAVDCALALLLSKEAHDDPAH